MCASLIFLLPLLCYIMRLVFNTTTFVIQANRISTLLPLSCNVVPGGAIALGSDSNLQPAAPTAIELDISVRKVRDDMQRVR